MRSVKPNKKIIARRFAESMATYDDNAIVQKEMADELTIAAVAALGTRTVDRIFELGCGTGLLTRRLAERFRPREMILNDLVPDCRRTAEQLAGEYDGMRTRFIAGDMETIEFPADCDLVAASAVIHWAEDVFSLLDRLAAALRPGGIMAIATFGPANLKELNELAGLSLHYPSLGDLQAGLRRSVEILAIRETCRRLHFANAAEAFRHLRETGVNALGTLMWSAGRLRRLAWEYEKACGGGRGVWLTYHPMCVVAEKRGMK